MLLNDYRHVIKISTLFYLYTSMNSRIHHLRDKVVINPPLHDGIVESTIRIIFMLSLMLNVIGETIFTRVECHIKMIDEDDLRRTDNKRT